MIQESLRPAPLPKGRLTPLQIGLILLGCALLGGIFYEVDVPAATVLILALGMGAICIRRFDTAFALLLGLGMSVSFNTILGLRPSNSGILTQLNLIDYAVILVLASMFINVVGREETFALPRHLRVPYTFFFIVTFFGMVYGGLMNGGARDTFLRDVRLFFFLHMSIIGVAWFIRRPKQLHFLATIIVVSGLICAAQQLLRFVLYGGEGLMGIRDVTLPVASLSFSIVFLFIYRYHRIPLLPKNTYPFVMSFLLIASLLTFARTLWAWLFVSYALSLLYMGGKQRARSLFAAMGAIVMLVFVVPFVVDLTAHEMNIQKLIESRYQQIIGKDDDIARQARLATTFDAWNAYTQSPIWGLGIGYPIYTYNVETRQTTEDIGLHNSILYYAIKVGAIGLLVLTWLIVVPIRRALWFASPAYPALNSDQLEVKAFAQALVAAFIPFSTIGVWSAILNYIPYMSLLGLVVGLNWDKIYAYNTSLPPTVNDEAEELRR